MAASQSFDQVIRPESAATVPVSDADIVRLSDTGRPARIGLWVLLIGFGGLLVWASLAPLDEGVPTQAMVTIDTKRKAVQHLSGGIVNEVFVKEGQFVKNDQPLIRLDDALVMAKYEEVRQHYYTLRAMEGRLTTEQLGLEKITFHPDLMQATRDPYALQTMTNQEKLFQSRRMALKADMQAIQESIQGQAASIIAYQGMRTGRDKQQAFIQEELIGVRDMVREGYMPRNKQLELERMSADAMVAGSDLQGNIQRARSSIAEMKMRAIQHTQEYRKEVDTQLSEVRREVQADAEKYKASAQELGRIIIRSPSEGQVVGITVQTVGAVVAPGQKLMDIVPRNEILLLETKVPPHLIDRVRPGLPTDVRFTSFAHAPTLVVHGTVESISSDLLTEPQTNTSYYLARISITPEGVKELGNRHMQAGMPAEVVIKTGERTVLTYLLHPLMKRMAAAMKEE